MQEAGTHNARKVFGELVEPFKFKAHQILAFWQEPVIVTAISYGAH